MASITSPVPQVGQPVGGQEAASVALLTEIRNLLNGGLESDNLATLFRNTVDPPVVSALPGDPVTGQRVRLRLGPGVLAPLRYNADLTGSFKWEADGGSVPLRSSTAAGTMGTVSAALTVPAAGIYDVSAFVETNQANPGGEIGLAVTGGSAEIGRQRTNTPGARLDFGPTRITLGTGTQNLVISAQSGGSMYLSGFSIQPVQVG
jgi:hypothetical protein